MLCGQATPASKMFPLAPAGQAETELLETMLDFGGYAAIGEQLVSGDTPLIGNYVRPLAAIAAIGRTAYLRALPAAVRKVI